MLMQRDVGELSTFLPSVCMLRTYNYDLNNLRVCVH